MNYKLLVLCNFVFLTQLSLAENKQKASIFKCVNNNGEIFYNDKPCPIKDRETQMRQIRDPLSVRKSSETPIFVKKTKKNENHTINKMESNHSKEKFILSDLKGVDEVLKSQIERENRARFFAGASDADERRALINDQYNNPPEGSRKPAGSTIKTQKLTEAMVNAQMEKDMSNQNR